MASNHLAVKLRQQADVPELDGSYCIPYELAASRFENRETSRRPSPSADIRGLPGLLLSALQQDS
ncbi:MAG: hypothetical protein RO469_06800 [Thermincola sp.]|nr:hypothetical protein [Thermincola sp.]